MVKSEATLVKKKTDKKRSGKHSQKLENFCTVRMIATVCNDSGKVEVKYISEHTDHELGVNECRNLPLPNSVEEEIKQHLQQELQLNESWIVSSYYINYSSVNIISHSISI